MQRGSAAIMLGTRVSESSRSSREFESFETESVEKRSIDPISNKVAQTSPKSHFHNVSLLVSIVDVCMTSLLKLQNRKKFADFATARGEAKASHKDEHGQHMGSLYLI